MTYAAKTRSRHADANIAVLQISFCAFIVSPQPTGGNAAVRRASRA
jgi:hypothetical protein